MRPENLWDEAIGVLGAKNARAWDFGIGQIYENPLRKYHGIKHIRECADWLGALIPDDARLNHPELSLALLLHDVVYDPRSAQNERDSAALARCMFGSDKIADLIFSTAHPPHEPRSWEEAMLRGIDLAGFAKDWADFQADSARIRMEYAHVSDETFAAGRARVLRSFLDRPQIYALPALEYLEPQARSNLERAVRELEAKR